MTSKSTGTWAQFIADIFFQQRPAVTRSLGIGSFVLLAAISVLGGESRPIYLDAQQPAEKRVEDLLARLTLEEKVSLVHADSVFTAAGVSRLGIPPLKMDDGPFGVREEVGEHFKKLGLSNDFATAMPAGIALAATWNPALAADEGAAIGQEAKARGKHVIFGPGINMMRTPLCGRNFEYFGEDPWLATRMGVSFIQGEQSMGVAACAKHFAANNQEFDRATINEIIDERTLREIYLPAFRAAVQEAGVLTVMGAYNQVNGGFCCQNGWLLNDVLRGEWGFKGLAISDWSGVHSTELTATHGVDIEMGTHTNYDNFFLATPYLEQLRAGKLSVADLDNKVRHRLYVMLRLGLIRESGSAVAGEAGGKIPSTPEHQAVAQRVAEESMVLLKNQGMLPLSPANVRTIAVIGGNAKAKFCNQGGSSAIKPPFEITAYAGLTNYLASEVKIIYAEGYHAPDKKMPWGVAWQEQAGSPAAAQLQAEAVAAAKMADLVVYVGGLNHTVGLDSESADRTSLKLPCGQDELINQIVAANPKTVVVLLAGAPVEMDEAWLNKVPALLFGWYPGMKGGDALARILFGEVNPSGKLPCTFPKRLADTPPFSFGAAAYPGTNGAATYAEGLLIGYRWFDAKEIAPLYPFGYGLSYTEFKYVNLELKSVAGSPERRVVEFDLSNTGNRAGAEVAQIYVAPETPPVFRPVKELKGFQKVFLAPGETRRVAVPLPADGFAYYDSGQKTWVSAKGNYQILVGASSRDIRLRGAVQLSQTVLTKANSNSPRTPAAPEQSSAYAESSKAMARDSKFKSK